MNLDMKYVRSEETYFWKLECIQITPFTEDDISALTFCIASSVMSIQIHDYHSWPNLTIISLLTGTFKLAEMTRTNQFLASGLWMNALTLTSHSIFRGRPVQRLHKEG